MQDPHHRRERAHRKVWELLPWYVNGTLAGEERGAVEAHLAACGRCQEEVRSCRVLEEKVQGQEELAPSPHPVQLARMLSRIDEIERTEGRQGWFRRLAGRILAPVRALPVSPVRGMLMAQLGVLLLIAGALLWQPWSTPAGPPAPLLYETRSEPVPVASEGWLIRMRFAEDATERQIRGMLLSVRGEIVAGPSPFGIYTIQIEPRGDALAGVLTHLRAQAGVQFAEPAAGQEP